MILKKSDIMDIYTAYEDGALISKPMKASVSYTVFKNMIKMKTAFHTIASDIDALNEEYGWEADKEKGGLPDDVFAEYSEKYNAMMNENVTLDLDTIKLSDIDTDITVYEMKVLYFMISVE